MAKHSDEKLKLLYIKQILEEESDSEHKISTNEIIERLSSVGIDAERKSVYRDIEALERFGMDISKKRTGTSVDSRLFELAELKLLVDAVQASKFISIKKSTDIIKKLSKLSSKYDAQKLKRGVYVSERVKNADSSVMYVIDGIHSAINANHMITFKYWEWTPDKKKSPKHGGKIYKLSPWGLVWDDENYYLLAYDDNFGGIKHFRVDKIVKFNEIDEPRKGYEQYHNLDLGRYSKKTFGMFNGSEETVILECSQNLAGPIFDRFGTDVNVFVSNNEKFRVAVNVKVSNTFLSWVFQFGKEMRIVSPQYVCDKMKDLIYESLEIYNK